MSVGEYYREFTKLGKYARHIIPTELDRVERFSVGQIRPIYNAMVETRFSTLTELVDRANMWQGRRDDEKKEREQQRKPAEKGETRSTAKTADRPLAHPYKREGEEEDRAVQGYTYSLLCNHTKCSRQTASTTASGSMQEVWKDSSGTL